MSGKACDLANSQGCTAPWINVILCEGSAHRIALAPVLLLGRREVPLRPTGLSGGKSLQRLRAGLVRARRRDETEAPPAAAAACRAAVALRALGEHIEGTEEGMG